MSTPPHYQPGWEVFGPIWNYAHNVYHDVSLMNFAGSYVELVGSQKNALCEKLDSSINAWYAGNREEAMEYAQDALLIARVLGGVAREAEWMSVMDAGAETMYRSTSLEQRLNEDTENNECICGECTQDEEDGRQDTVDFGFEFTKSEDGQVDN